MRDPEQYREIVEYFPLEALVTYGIVILVLWGIIWFIAGRRSADRRSRSVLH